MSLMVESASEIFFAGGSGDNSGAAATNGGGVVGSYWAGLTAGEVDLSLIMGTDGEALETVLNADIDSVTNSGGSVLVTAAGKFATSLVGHIVYFNGTGSSYATGRYAITAIGSGTITLDLAYIDATKPTSVAVGGAIDTWENAEAAVTNTTTIYNVIFLRRGLAVTTGTLTCTAAGSPARGGILQTVGYHTDVYCDGQVLASDMMFGRKYYGGSYGELTGTAGDECWASIDGDGGAYHLITADGKDCYHWYCVDFTNVATATKELFNFANTPVYWLFNNCRFRNARAGIFSGCDSFTFIDCYFDDSITYQHILATNSLDHSYIGNCFKNAAGKASVSIGELDVAIDNIFVNGTIGINLKNGNCVISNNIFYNQTTSCIKTGGTLSGGVIYNNIFWVPAINDYAIYVLSFFGTGQGHLPYYNHNITYCPAGAITKPVWQGDGNIINVGENNILDFNPEFQDAARFDFRSNNTKVLNGGLPTTKDNQSMIGARAPHLLGGIDRNRARYSNIDGGYRL